MILFIWQGNSGYNSSNLMSWVSGSLNKFAFRFSALALALLLAGDVFALGLGELRSTPSLGERPRLEIEILGSPKEVVDPACFRLRPPSGGDDLPWLKRATFTVRKGSPAVLEIRSDLPLRDPIVQLSIQVGCGHEIVRNYIILASPEPVAKSVTDSYLPSPRTAQAPAVVSRSDDLPAPRKRPSPKAKVPRPVPEQLEKVAPGRIEPRVSTEGLSDRLMLSGGGDAGDPSLRLSTEMLSSPSGQLDISEAQREILRLEFRMLLALNEQATTQLAATEKLRSLEASLTELQQRATEIAQKSEPSATPAVPPVVAGPPAAIAKPVVVEPESSFVSEWGLYGLLLALLLVVGGWLGWRNYRERQSRSLDEELGLVPPEFAVDPKRDGEHEELGGVDLDVDPAIMGAPMQVDFPLDESEGVPSAAKPVAAPKYDSLMSISAATVDEHFEANPVMELADIMLSFGRVKGAAQALQEYIDHNPQEALQPWIRLMDVYRMAGLREEFDNVARNLNQNFNVEIQQWDPAEPALNRHTIDMVLDDDVAPATKPPPPPKAETIEDMPRIIQQVTELWRDGDVIGYLQQLLRDNREGKRAGFPLQVVSDMLFLVDLKEMVLKAEATPDVAH